MFKKTEFRNFEILIINSYIFRNLRRHFQTQVSQFSKKKNIKYFARIITMKNY